MVEISPVGTAWRLVLSQRIYDRLESHLFPGDGDEHGAVILAGVATSDRGFRLIARELHLADDGRAYVPGTRGYRMLTADFIGNLIRRARDQRLAYLAIHNHGGANSVAFSHDDLASHNRGYPALLDIARGMPVGALVLARNAIAGDLWFSTRKHLALDHAIVVGKSRRLLYPSKVPTEVTQDSRFDRQCRLFGGAGQKILRATRVGIVGLGGAGSILAELLGRLGVGGFVLCDVDRAEESNLCRLVGARRWDVRELSPLRRLLFQASARKVDMAARNIRRANCDAKIDIVQRDFVHANAVERFLDCDYLFLAADSMRARLLFNAVVHQYGIPGHQVGVKIRVNDSTGEVGDVMCLSRPVSAESGCLWCNGLISPGALQEEAIPAQERQQQRYLSGDDAPAPSVVTLNAIACAHAVNDFLFYTTGLFIHGADEGYFRYTPRTKKAWYDQPRRDGDCTECSLSDASRLSRGDLWPLPTHAG